MRAERGDGAGDQNADAVALANFAGHSAGDTFISRPVHVFQGLLHAIIAHRRRGDPLTLEAGIVRVADALDMAKGRSRVPFEAGRMNIHSLSAAAIDEVRIDAGEDKAVRIEIDMNNSSGIFQIDELLATKLRGSGLEDHVEVVAQIEAEHEKRLVPLFRL